MGLYHHNVNVNLNANWPDGMGLYHHNVNVNLNANRPDGMGLTGTLTADAELGDIHVNAGWNSHAYVARYTDTAFMRPYINHNVNLNANFNLNLNVNLN
jgi:hypothetical protein